MSKKSDEPISSCFVKEYKEFNKNLNESRNKFKLDEYLCYEISLCINSGRYYAALALMCILLENFVLETLIQYYFSEYRKGNLIIEIPGLKKINPSEESKIKNTIECYILESQKIKFKSALSKLPINKEIHDEGGKIYDSIRIPIHHGLNSRFIKKIQEEYKEKYAAEEKDFKIFKDDMNVYIDYFSYTRLNKILNFIITFCNEKKISSIKQK